MYNELREEKIIIEFESLVKNAESFDEDTCCYAEFMKQRILSVSGNN